MVVDAKCLMSLDDYLQQPIKTQAITDLDGSSDIM
jgi:hypothetical protein